MKRTSYADFKCMKSVRCKEGKRSFCVQYHEHGKAGALLKINNTPIEAGSAQKVRRSFNTVVMRHYARQGKEAPPASLLLVHTDFGGTMMTEAQ
jgi:hypothetical protein